MARDLIPPPSPAGRPQPEGTPLLVELPPEPALEQPLQPPATPAAKLPPSRFRNRFGFLIGALGGVVVASALVLAAVLVSSGNAVKDFGLEPNWSAWQPSGTDLINGSAEIADKVDDEYRHPDGNQLTKVKGTPLGIDVQLRSAGGDITTFEGDHVIYQLNGLGPFGSIRGGTPSPQRLQMVRREALELALYTFRYLPDADGVVVLLPPPPPKAGTPAASATSGLLEPGTVQPETTEAIFYRPGDLMDRLQIPLGSTMGVPAPKIGQIDADEGKLIDDLTLSNLFKWAIVPNATQQPELVLTRPS